ncbi:Na+/H+ antiporter NhaA [Micromonospora sicca]|nr:Na+/H+ antiporter NhaA [Micromonospora sp. ATA51]
MSQLAGIGFTVSLLISELAYPNNEGLLNAAKSAILVASAAATVLAAATLLWRGRHHRRARHQAHSHTSRG